MKRMALTIGVVMAAGAWAQTPPPPGPGAAAGAEKTIAPKKPTCEEARRKGKYNPYFDKVELEKLVQIVADVTCKQFIMSENFRGKITIIGPETGKFEVDADQFFQVFLAALDANGMTVYQHGRFMKIIEKQKAKQSTVPTIVDPEEPYTTNEQMVTRIFKVRYVEIETLRGVLNALVTQAGDTIPFPPDSIIVNDLGSNMHRLQKIADQLDSKSSSDEIRVLQINYATAQEIADKVTKLFEMKTPRPGVRPGNLAPFAPGRPTGEVPGGAPGAATSGGPTTLTQLIPDERTNKLIVIASPGAIERIMGLIREIDIPVVGGEKINVYYLENASAEDLASTLQTLAQGTANRPKTPGGAPPPPGQPRGSSAAELFSGEVKVSADKASNALVIVASQNDYRSMVRVIEKLDIRQRQVFVEAVIMEVSLDRGSTLGINLHGGIPLNSASQLTPIVFGTKYSTAPGLPPSISVNQNGQPTGLGALGNLLSLAGFLTGVQGTQQLSLGNGVTIPAFGLVLNALQNSADVNVLSTPHLLTTNNEEAEIVVGQTIPFQSGISAVGNLAGLAGGLGNNPAAGALGGLLGGGLPLAQIQRLNVDLKLSIKPQINESDYIRLVINETIEELAPGDNALGPSTSKRSAKTTVVAKDQETVVIGGIMKDTISESVAKVPILGDIPLIGNLFRQTVRKKVKTNLLLFLTPYIIRDSSDFRRIFERKMKERQEFVEQFYGASTQYDVAIDFARKPGPLARMAQVLNKEMNKIENGGMGSGEKLIAPGGATEEKAPTTGPVSPPGAATPKEPGQESPVEVPPAPVTEPNIETLKAPKPVEIQ